MASWKWLLAAASATLLATPSSAESSSDAVIYSLQTVPDWQTSSAIILQVSSPEADIVTQQFTVIPLTAVLGLNQSQETRGSVDISGELILATQSNYANISGSNQIAYLCCDNMTSSFIDANMMFNALMETLPAAILLYSQVGNCCNIDGSNLAYQNILTMVDNGEASQTLNITTSSAAAVQAKITGNTTSTDSNGQETQSGNNSAIAMSILYSITGLITLLFLVIIATGAIRAHRYPERYGPRSGYGGRPRQSRAKGIARAVLETLPIVKFNGPGPAKPDPSMELESASDNQPDTTLDRNPTDVQVHHLSTIPEDAETQPKVHNLPGTGASGAIANTLEPNSNIGSANSAPASRGSTITEDNEHLGCSICTEDFSVGEDVRVLPCDHKFHPHCVDPWLVNVSGTCPLCRLDLRPNNGEPGTVADGQANMPPPLDTAETTNTAAVEPSVESTVESAVEPSGASSRHRSSRLFDLHRLRHAPVEERIEALRRYRVENQAAHQSSSEIRSTGEDEHSREKLTKRLRDKFRIRTRAQSPNSSSRS